MYLGKKVFLLLIVLVTFLQNYVLMIPSSLQCSILCVV
jgi:hypothetical protein